MSALLESDAGQRMSRLMERLFPLHRAITGDGLRATFDILSELLPLEISEIPTGTPVLDWHIPQEWRIRDAYVADASGRRIVDYRQSNLHVVNYSRPVREWLTWDALADHVFTVPGKPDWIPYRTLYFRDDWGFCVSERQAHQLRSQGNDPLEVVIDADLVDGSLTIAECILPGASDATFLIYCHACHPSLANDNLSGIVVATQLAHEWLRRERKYTYRFVFAPATIGAITWLAIRQADVVPRIVHGLVLTLLGSGDHFIYKRSRRESADIDRAVERVFADREQGDRIQPFSPQGYDERQFCSPGFNLPVGCLMRSEPARFPEYHTSADNLDFVKADCLLESLDLCRTLVTVLEHNGIPVNLRPYGEPQLGRHGIYRAWGERDDRGRLQEAMLWVLNLADGHHDLLAIADRSRLAWTDVTQAVQWLMECQLIRCVDGLGGPMEFVPADGRSRAIPETSLLTKGIAK